MDHKSQASIQKLAAREEVDLERKESLSEESISNVYNLTDPHYVVFIEDGQSLTNCKSFKIDLTFFKAKYFIEPPKYISQLPEEYINIQKKFNKRAFMELLEICSVQLADRQKSFSILYTLDGEIIESMEDIR